MSERCNCGRPLKEQGLGDVCTGCANVPDACGCEPALDPASALERLRKAADSAGDDPDLVPVAVDAELRAMATQGMDVPVRLAVRSYLAREKKRIGLGVRDLEQIEKETAAERAAEVMSASSAADLDSHPAVETSAEVDGAALLDEVREMLLRFLVFPGPEAVDAAVLYAAATHAQRELQFAPRFSIRSPAKRCGKSRLFDLMALLCHAPLPTVNISAAALVHAITEDDPPTIMLDEADATFSKALKQDEKAEHLRGILNAGFDRGRPYIRHDYTSHQNEECPTFAMAILAGIGRLPDTIEDRSVTVTLQRKAPGERVQKFRIRKHAPVVRAMGTRLRSWVAPLAAKIGEAEPEMPEGLNDRAEDTWEALLAVADFAGGTWPERARRAAQVLTGQVEEKGAMSLRLLADLRTVFGDQVKLHTRTILVELCKLPESPWRDYYGKQVTDREVAGLLSEYHIKSCQVKIDGENLQGYRREDLYDAWNRYLSPVSGKSPGQLLAEAERLRAAAEELETEAKRLAAEVGPTSPTAPTAQVSQVVLNEQQALLPLPGRGGRAQPEANPTALSSQVGPVGEVGPTPPNETHSQPCPGCGATEDSNWHAVKCLGEDHAA